MNERKAIDNIALDEAVLDEYLHYKEGETIHEISEDEYIANQEAEDAHTVLNSQKLLGVLTFGIFNPLEKDAYSVRLL